MTAFEYLIIISIDFYDFTLPFLLSFSFDWEDVSRSSSKRTVNLLDLATFSMVTIK